MKKSLVLAALAAIVLFPLVAAQPARAAVDALALVPQDAITVGAVRFVDLRSSSLAKMLFQQTDNVGCDGDAAAFLHDAGLQPSRDIDVLVIATSPVTALGSDAKLLLAADGRFDVDRLASAITSRGGSSKTAPNGTYFLMPDRARQRSDSPGAVAFPSSKLALVGSEAAVVQALADYAAGGTSFATAGGLGREMSLVDPHATAWVLIDVPRASRLKGAPHVPAQRNGADNAITSAVKGLSTVALWATDGGDALKVGATGLTQDEETRGLLEDTLRGMLAAWRLAVQDKSPELVSMLRKFTVVNSATGVTISGSIPAETLKALKFNEHASRAHADKQLR
jgi:hypothetical protein